MRAAIDALRESLGLCAGDEVEARVAPGTASGMLPWLEARRVHEFFAEGVTAGEWHGPLTLLAALAMELAPSACMAWIGRRCWPTFQHFRRTGAKESVVLRRHLFLDPLSDAERLWGLLEACRCPAVRVVVADGSMMNPTAGRRLQLAAETGNAVVLLARPPSELSEPTWAATRWRVKPEVSTNGQPRWNVALVRVTGAGLGQDASRHWSVSWTYEVFCGSGALDLSAGVGRGTGASPREGEAGGARRQTA